MIGTVFMQNAYNKVMQQHNAQDQINQLNNIKLNYVYLIVLSTIVKLVDQ